MCWTARASPANCRRPHLTKKTRSASAMAEVETRLDGEGEDGWAQGVSMLDTAGSSRSWTGRIRSVTGRDNKKVSQRALRTELWHSRRNGRHWQCPPKTATRYGSLEYLPCQWRKVCATASHTLGVRTPWARKGCVRSCPWNETQLPRQGTAMAIGRRDPLGLAKRPTGRHRKARVEPTPALRPGA